MKSNRIILAALATVLFAGCETEEKLLKNHLFIATDLKNEVRVATDEGITTLVREVSVGIASPAAIDIEAEFTASPELLDTYREAYYDQEALLLPEKHYKMDDMKVVIRSGDVASGKAALSFTNLGVDQGLDYTKTYVLPVTVASNDIDVLSRAKTIYYVVKEASLVNVVGDMTSNCAWPEWGEFNEVENLETFTMEALINCHGFNNKEIETIMGIEDHCLIRIGDAQLPKNQLQIALSKRDVDDATTYRGNLSDASLQLRADRWYHIAMTFDKGYVKVYLDGRLKIEKDCSLIGSRPGNDGQTENVYFTSVNFKVPHSDEMDNKPRCFWIGYSYNNERYLDGMIAEARVWNRVLSAEEIAAPNHFYKLYPDKETGKFDPSLLAYWKFNEGEGKTIKDWSIYGNNLTADHDLLWYPVALPVK